MSLSRSSRQYLGVRALQPPDLQLAERAPTSTDTAYVKGTLWLDTTGGDVWMHNGAGSWIVLGGDNYAIETLTGDSGGAISPVAGNIDILGTADQVDIVGTAGTLTASLPDALIAPGSIEATTTLTATLGDITATDGDIVLGAAGNKIMSTSVGSAAAAGANSFGTVTLVGGTVTVATTSVTANSIIMLTRQSVGSTGANDLGILSVGTIVAGTSFDINAWTVTNATALQADDVSVIGWMIIN